MHTNPLKKWISKSLKTISPRAAPCLMMSQKFSRSQRNSWEISVRDLSTETSWPRILSLSLKKRRNPSEFIEFNFCSINSLYFESSIINTYGFSRKKLWVLINLKRILIKQVFRNSVYLNEWFYFWEWTYFLPYIEIWLIYNKFF